MAFAQTVIKVGGATHQRVTAVKRQLEQARGRQVTYAEVVDELVRHWEASARLLQDVKEAGRG